MPPKNRRKSPTVVERLLADASDFEFFQAVRLLERAALMAGDPAAGTPAAGSPAAGSPASLGLITTPQPLARFAPPEREYLRFGNQLSLGFPGASIESVERTAQENRYRMLVNFFGLTGATGVLPFHYSELIFQRLKLKDRALKNFLDMFQHRSLSLFFQAGVRNRLPIAYERHKVQKLPGRDSHTQALLSLIGLGTAQIDAGLPIPAEGLLFFSGFLAQKTRPAINLKPMLSHFLGVPVQVDELVGQWQPLIDDVRLRLPSKNNPSGQNARLGRSAILGQKGWFAQGKLRIVAGPLTARQFKDFAPGTQTLNKLHELSSLYVGAENEIEYRLKTTRDQLPGRVQLNRKEPPVLGWDTWFGCRTRQQPSPADTVEIKVSSARLQQGQRQQHKRNSP